ncbi:unnamed protein product [Closterium sp. Yama58-4]|nr:unnamed protein product [Closterium sp. Yama58-4]
MSYNNLTGALPDALSSATSLTSFAVAFNQLSGNLPPALGNLPSLSFLDIRGNAFSGYLPPSYSNIEQFLYDGALPPAPAGPSASPPPPPIPPPPPPSVPPPSPVLPGFPGSGDGGADAPASLPSPPHPPAAPGSLAPPSSSSPPAIPHGNHSSPAPPAPPSLPPVPPVNFPNGSHVGNETGGRGGKGGKRGEGGGSGGGVGGEGEGYFYLDPSVPENETQSLVPVPVGCKPCAGGSVARRHKKLCMCSYPLLLEVHLGMEFSRFNDVTRESLEEQLALSLNVNQTQVAVYATRPGSVIASCAVLPPGRTAALPVGVAGHAVDVLLGRRRQRLELFGMGAVKVLAVRLPVVVLDRNGGTAQAAAPATPAAAVARGGGRGVAVPGVRRFALAELQMATDGFSPHFSRIPSPYSLLHNLRLTIPASLPPLPLPPSNLLPVTPAPKLQPRQPQQQQSPGAGRRGVAVPGVRRFALAELQMATDDFSPHTKLRDHPLGPVYCGDLPDGTKHACEVQMATDDFSPHTKLRDHPLGPVYCGDLPDGTVSWSGVGAFRWVGNMMATGDFSPHTKLRDHPLGLVYCGDWLMARFECGAVRYGGFGSAETGFSPHTKLQDHTFGEVAVRRIEAAVVEGQSDSDFEAVAANMARLQHAHVVPLQGYCVDGGERMLVFEHFHLGSLYEHLHDGSRSMLMTWDTRVNIAVGCAQALEYLHEECVPAIVHRGVSSRAILLDDHMSPRIADAGLAVLNPTDNEAQTLSEQLVGGYAYNAPEYAMSGVYTAKSDVYSFGVVLLELLTGRKPVDPAKPKWESSLVRWAAPLLHDVVELERMVDPTLAGPVPDPQASRTASLPPHTLLSAPSPSGSHRCAKPKWESSLVRWAAPLLHDVVELERMVDPTLAGPVPDPQASPPLLHDVVELEHMVDPTLAGPVPDPQASRTASLHPHTLLAAPSPSGSPRCAKPKWESSLVWWAAPLLHDVVELERMVDPTLAGPVPDPQASRTASLPPHTLLAAPSPSGSPRCAKPKWESSLVRWAAPLLHDVVELERMVDPTLAGPVPDPQASRTASLPPHTLLAAPSPSGSPRCAKPKWESSLVRWAAPLLHDVVELERMVDPTLAGPVPDPLTLTRYAEVIARCIQPEPEFRPRMSKVVRDLCRRSAEDPCCHRQLPLITSRLTLLPPSLLPPASPVCLFASSQPEPEFRPCMSKVVRDLCRRVRKTPAATAATSSSTSTQLGPNAL